MKHGAILLSVFVLLFSCNPKQADKEVTGKDTAAAIIPVDTGNVITDSHYFWSADLDPKKGLVMIKTRPVPTDSLTSANIIQMMNETYPEIPLQFIKISNDSIFVRINKSNYLTQQMGSSGAEAYLAEATYNLTEIKDINFVVMLFKEGDHASPGVYNRTDFVK